jgi:hypothetical protein
VQKNMFVFLRFVRGCESDFAVEGDRSHPHASNRVLKTAKKLAGELKKKRLSG